MEPHQINLDVKMTATTEEQSELMSLLVKNTRDGLTVDEEVRAIQLIGNPVYVSDVCALCKMNNPDTAHKSIYDTGMCQDHAAYALATRK